MDKRLESAGEDGPGIPRDMPDEQAGGADEHWDGDLAGAAGEDEPEERRPAADADPERTEEDEESAGPEGAGSPEPTA
ncbi:hypothetical protein NX801_04285 [Streptomyces sp. LP05-1]|uniref:Uncharacterized protein n=1 Tax=Streptomyces pyxinae TaxID=2970734 RepID=A0ABT2CC48_9ACTN|nr:hypothetical protein [Streptomyces sp. LP05-1]MCS0634890.1 hypothetical protein [Streptomyces sp. LP05-1]